MSRTDIVAVNTRSGRSHGNEVWLLAALGARGERLSLRFCEDSWQRMEKAGLAFGLSGGPFHKTEQGSVSIAGEEVSTLYFLSHGWSGMVDIGHGSRVRRIDLYSSDSHVVALDPKSGRKRLASPSEIEEVFAGEIGPQRRSRDAAAPPEPARVRVMSGTVALLEARTAGDASTHKGSNAAIMALAESAPGWTLESLAHAKGSVLRGGQGAKLDIDLGPDDELIFLREPRGGRVRISLGGRTSGLDLDGDFAPVRVQARAFLRGDQPNALMRLPRDASLIDLSSIDPRKPIAVYLPRWKGVAMSTRMLFDQSLAITPAETHPDGFGPDDILRFSTALLGTACRHFVVSGGDLFWLEIIRKVQLIDPGIRFDLLWHSNYAQIGEPHDFRLFSHWLAAHSAGMVTRIGVVKEGYDEFLRTLGVDAVFIPNIVRTDIQQIQPSSHDGSVGVWLSGSSHYRKPVLPSLLALALSGKHALRGAGLGEKGVEAAGALGLRIAEVHANPIPSTRLHREMARTAATLYVTLSECSPMLPLESMALGVPCLVGPASHLFRNDPALREWLVVENPMDAQAIAAKLERAIEDRDAIIEAYRAYALAELDQSSRSIQRLLS